MEQLTDLNESAFPDLPDRIHFSFGVSGTAAPVSLGILHPSHLQRPLLESLWCLGNAGPAPRRPSPGYLRIAGWSAIPQLTRCVPLSNHDVTGNPFTSEQHRPFKLVLQVRACSDED